MTADLVAGLITWVVGLTVIAALLGAINYANRWWPERWDHIRRHLS